MDRNIITSLLIGTMIASLTSANVHRVPAEYTAIQDAVNAAVDGDTILVAPGIYSGQGNRDILVSKSLAIQSETGPRGCILDCAIPDGRADRGFYFLGRPVSKNVILRGFTITNAVSGIVAGGVDITISDCIVSGNGGLSYGGGIRLSECDAEVRNCVITANAASSSGSPYDESYGGGVYCGASTAVFSNCVISGNAAKLGGGVAWMSTHAGRFENCVVRDNRAFLGRGNQVLCGSMSESCPAGPCPNMGLALFANCCMDADPNALLEKAPYGTAPGDLIRLEDCIVADPEFALAGHWDPNGTPEEPNDDYWVDGDYHLRSQAGRYDPDTDSWVADETTSPCIDAGDRVCPTGHEPFPNGGIVNIGIYGGTCEASKSWFGGPVCSTIVAGDINGDCRVDFRDLSLLTENWCKQSDNFNCPPIVEVLLEPAEGEQYAFLPILIRAGAWDIDGEVVKVEFVIDGSAAGEEIGHLGRAIYNSEDYVWSLTWDSDGPYSDGLYSLTAIATDNEGATGHQRVSFTIYAGGDSDPDR